ncbi:hypothetical protein HD601_005909 [Jiangella mangrovi]|uniref:Uncharacterized protein n=1 Tax=Jiangella mangrovi TaxID=1524084 RepID=A0A7W9GX13_9ACTN|nr:hypothetical protein [Jiangella mangrovi]
MVGRGDEVGLPVPLLPILLAGHARLKSDMEALRAGEADLTRAHPAKNLAAIRGTGRPWARLAPSVPVSSRFGGLRAAMIINDPLHHHDYPSPNTIAGVMRIR